MTVTRHFGRAKASGEIPKSYAVLTGGFLDCARNDGVVHVLEMTV